MLDARARAPSPRERKESLGTALPRLRCKDSRDLGEGGVEAVKRVLGIDPGTSSHGWALLDLSTPARPLYLEGGRTADVRPLLAREGLGMVAVERAVALWKPEANVHAMSTAWEGGWIAGFAAARGHRVVWMGATEWRTALVGHSEKGENVDGKVKTALLMFVREFPARSSVHLRDAAGVACVAARDWRQRLAVR